jgi:hypothetical protein
MDRKTSGRKEKRIKLMLTKNWIGKTAGMPSKPDGWRGQWVGPDWWNLTPTSGPNYVGF